MIPEKKKERYEKKSSWKKLNGAKVLYLGRDGNFKCRLRLPYNKRSPFRKFYFAISIVEQTCHSDLKIYSVSFVEEGTFCWSQIGNG